MYEVQSLLYSRPLIVEEWFSLLVAPKLCSAFLVLDGLAELPKHVKRVKKKELGCAVLVAPVDRGSVSSLLVHTGIPDQVGFALHGLFRLIPPSHEVALR